jgi:hypothetical protein
MNELRLRLWVRARRWRLDHELATCDAPYGTPPRALRARQLDDPRARADLARSLRRIVAEAERDRVVLLSSAVPIRSAAIRDSREALLGLAERLENPAAVNPRGLARVRLLLTDATGPIFSPSSAVSLPAAIWHIADGLQLCPPHDWRCPVVIKLDPEHVAWTCAVCGAVASSDSTSEQPCQ